MTKSPSNEERTFRKKIVEDIRPWGKFRAYPHQNAASLKIITVRPGASLSLQFHRRRSEFWVVLDPGLEITIGRKAWRPKKGEEIFIPKKAPHRLKCVGKSPARVMEIWLGRSVESDIVRLEDLYNRK
ncbi:MAG: phosphomannose isomerase type II C-terminal cupin domain [Candidatus Aminicenantes bacterium]|jgi:mannose-6-phosphate isomerase|nr:phosphomannose isomerase type II C-terminal cupin domain [Candidatus Aminicenantes bacterium]